MNRGAATENCVVVVGSGPCGATAAAQLVGRGVNVVMLDAGLSAPRGIVIRAGGNTVFRIRDSKRYETARHVTTPGDVVEWCSSRTLGGLSNYWTGAVPRFAPEDFTDGAAVDERYEWPITYDDLAPYYERAEKALVVTAGRPFANIPASAARFRVDPPPDWAELSDRAAVNGQYLGPIPMAKGTPWMAAGRGTEFGSYHCIVKPLLTSPLFRLVRGAVVARLNWNSSEARVESVDYLDRDTGAAHTVRARAVVVAAGAIDSTVLLLRSVSADFPAGLGNNAGVVGRYLHDHPKEWWPAQPAPRMSALAHPMYLSREPFGTGEPLMATSLTFGLASHRLHTYLRTRPASFGVQVFGTMVPRPEVGVSIAEQAGADPVSGRPLISLRYDQQAMDNIFSARQRLSDLFSDAGLRVTMSGPFHPLTPGASIHFGGTVRMHRSPEFGVLDRWNRVHDAPNVLVCDSSCFTTGPEKNPTLTAMSIAARAADHLAGEMT
jgi:choline dehydrogenase-like flavoprotein